MKKTILVLFLSISFVLFGTSCNYQMHEHTYSDDWSYNEYAHWHQSTCIHNLKKDSGIHTYDNNYQCTECGYINNKLIHDYFYINSWDGSLRARNISRLGSVVSIPEEIDGITVRSIEARAFYGAEQVKTVILPNTLERIGEGAFSRCFELSTINLPNSLISIESEAFCSCRKLSSIEVPVSVKTIGSDAFGACTALQNIDVNPENQFFCSVDGNLMTKDKSTLLAVPAGKKGTIVITAPIVDSRALSGCSSIETIVVSSDTNTLSGVLFNGCSSLAEIIVDYGNPWFYSAAGCLFNSSNELLKVPAMKEGFFVVPDSTIGICSFALSDCMRLTEITIPDSVSSIGTCAFRGCSGLNKITIPHSVSKIGSSAFSGCSGIESITIPNSSISFEYDSKYYGSFSGFNGTVILSDGIKTIPYSIFRWSNVSVVLPSSLTSVADYAFHCWNGSKDISIPEGVTSIGDWAFYSSGITSVSLPSSLLIIEEDAFSQCKSLQEVVFLGTINQWKAVRKKESFRNTTVTTVKCSDGVTSLI